jgi:hypothetical protein
VGAVSADLLPFVQVELAGSIGLDDGRFLGRDPKRVLVVRVLGAPQPPRRRLRKPKPKVVEPGSEGPTVPLTELTMIRPEPLGSADDAAQWLAGLRDDEDAVEAELVDALRTANLALHAHRLATLDPYLADVASEHALALRVGYGEGEALADGRWSEAIEIPLGTRRRRLEMLAPQERIAAALGRREALDAATGALLRARVDLDAGRLRDAALQLRVGLEALLADRDSFSGPGQADDLAALDERKPLTGQAANEALHGDLSAERAAEVEATLKRCERVLRRRRAYG